MRLRIGAIVALACACHGSRAPDDHAAAPAIDAAPPALLQITAKTISVRGERVAGVHGAKIDDADLAPDASGIPTIAKLRQQLEDAHLRSDERVAIEIDPAAPYGAMFTVLYSLHSAHFKHMALISPAGAPPVDVDIPDATPSSFADDPRKDPSLRMIVTLAADTMVVFSASGSEGTLRAPKLAAPRGGGGDDVAALRRTLRGIVDAQWGHGEPRADVDRRIVVMVDVAIPVADVMAVVRATRTDADGTPLFPETVFSSGFE